MNLQLPDDLNEFVLQQLSTGQFASRDELIAYAVRLLRDWNARLEALRAEVQIGIDQADQGLGRPVELEAIIARGKARLAAEGIRD